MGWDFKMIIFFIYLNTYQVAICRNSSSQAILLLKFCVEFLSKICIPVQIYHSLEDIHLANQTLLGNWRVKKSRKGPLLCYLQILIMCNQILHCGRVKSGMPLKLKRTIGKSAHDLSFLKNSILSYFKYCKIYIVQINKNKRWRFILRCPEK